MEEKSKKIATVLTLLGPILIFLSLCFPWFVFAGTAEYRWGTVEVSGSVSAIGKGTLDGGGAQVTMWSSTTHWSSAGSDFWFGYLSVVGLILVSASVLVFMKTDRMKASMLLALIGGSMAVSASLIAMMHYEPHTFVIFGQIYDIPTVNTALLYETQATVKNGLGSWLSLIGGLLSIISMIPVYHLKTRKKG